VLPGRKRVDQEGGSGSKEGTPQPAAAVGAGEAAAGAEAAGEAAAAGDGQHAQGGASVAKARGS
jgi:hypothetical protein